MDLGNKKANSRGSTETILDGNRADDDKCSLKEFTSKRREILLINLSIQTQQQQIDSMKADLEKRSMALRQKEQDLADSMKRFDTFLQEMNQKQSMTIYMNFLVVILEM